MQTVGRDPLVGRSLGEYQVDQLLGRGELSTVYIAHTAQRRQVMIMMFNPPEGMSAQEGQRFTMRFAQEGASLVRLKHRNILPTYDFGELAGRPYLVTALVKGVTLKQLLKRQGRFTLEQTLDILKQMGGALDYAHSNGVTHDLFGVSSILIDQDSNAQIINFGAKIVFEAHRRMQNEQPAGAHSDIYALGIVLFELLSGTPLFEGESPSNIASKRLPQPIPSIHAQYPDVPEMIDQVISKTLERDPAKGYQQASDIVFAFEHVLRTMKAMSGANPANTRKLAQDPQLTLPPTVNWFDEASILSDKSEVREEWEQALSSTTLPGVTSSFSAPESRKLTAMQSSKAEETSAAENSSDAMTSIDPLDRWSVTDVKSTSQQPIAGTFVQRTLAGLGVSHLYSQRQPVQANRRKVVALIAAGTVTATALALGGINLMQHMQQPPASRPTATKNTTSTFTKQSTLNTRTTTGAQNTPTPAPTATPTQQPIVEPTPTPRPYHTGTVIGYTSQAFNTARNFTNPADGQDALLIRLPNGSYVAGETSCTHRGVAVNYDPGSQQLVCPAHGAVFDPANGFKLLSGPGNGPLTSVSIRMNSDGTITTG